MVIEGWLHAGFWVWMELWRWLQHGVVILMFFCLDMVMVLGVDLTNLMMNVELWCGDGVERSCGGPRDGGDGVGREMKTQ